MSAVTCAATEKVAIRRAVLLQRRPVSEVCESHRIRPSQCCTRQKQPFEGGAAALGCDATAEHARALRRIEALKAHPVAMDEVIADTSQEYVPRDQEHGAR